MKLGWPHPDVLCDVLTPEQMDEWWAFHTIEPFGDEWERTAMSCAVMHNTSGAKHAAKIEDYMPNFQFKKQPAKKPTGSKMTGNAARDYLKNRFGKSE